MKLALMVINILHPRHLIGLREANTEARQSNRHVAFGSQLSFTTIWVKANDIASMDITSKFGKIA